MCHTKNDSIYFLRHNQIEACCFISCINKTLYEAFSIRYSGGMRTIRMRPKHIERSEGTFRAIERDRGHRYGYLTLSERRPCANRGNHRQSP